MSSVTFQKTGPSKFVVGKCFDYVLTLTTTDAVALNLTFEDTLPAGVTLVSVTASQVTSFVGFNNGIVEVSIDFVPANTVCTVIIRVRPEKKCTLTNIATVDGFVSGNRFSLDDTWVATPLQCTSKWAIQRWKQCEAIQAL